MRITGYRTLTTVQDWGRPVGDANGVYADGLVATNAHVVTNGTGSKLDKAREVYVQFGDGARGARLPSGSNNAVEWYPR